MIILFFFNLILVMDLICVPEFVLFPARNVKKHTLSGSLIDFCHIHFCNLTEISLNFF